MADLKVHPFNPFNSNSHVPGACGHPGCGFTADNEIHDWLITKAVGSPVTQSEHFFEYVNQAWIVDGKYEDCGHPNQDCGCYGRAHKGEAAHHSKDSDCCVDPDTNLCIGYGVEHGDECPDCGGRGFHKPTCESLRPDAVSSTPVDTLSEMIAIQDANELLQRTNNQNCGGTLTVWRILEHAKRHLNKRMAELLGEDAQ